MNLFEIEEYDNLEKKRNLDVKSSGIITSTKYFPVFEENEKEIIIKPLSKTKPFSTPLFSYSEVYWSYLTNKYIDSNTPVYKLAICKNLTQEQPKYFEKGCRVENILKEGEHLVNLLEFFRKNQEEGIEIDNYINYCEVQYDYEPILRSTFFRKNKELGKSLAEQILCSILRRDENYHYENVSFIEKDGKIIKIAPMLDFEYSQMFMYPDMKELHEARFSHYDEGMGPLFKYDATLSYKQNLVLFQKKLEEETIYDQIDDFHFSNLKKNLKTIVELYPELVEKFMEKISRMKKEVEELNIEINNDFIGSFSSLDWEPTRMLLKGGKKENDKEYLYAKKRAEENKITLNQQDFIDKLKKETIWSIDKLTYILSILLNEKIKDYENKTLYKPVYRFPEEVVEQIQTYEHQKILAKK